MGKPGKIDPTVGITVLAEAFLKTRGTLPPPWFPSLRNLGIKPSSVELCARLTLRCYP
jgi:hypothetical protein